MLLSGVEGSLEPGHRESLEALARGGRDLLRLVGDLLDHARIDEEAQAALRAGRRFRAEYRMVTVGGDLVWVLHEAPLVANSAGQPVLGAGALIDVTARKREEETLRASEERHRFLTEHSTDMITVLSPDAQYL